MKSLSTYLLDAYNPVLLVKKEDLCSRMANHSEKQASSLSV